MPPAQRRAQWLLLRRLLRRGVGLGLVAAVAGLSLGYIRGGRTTGAALDGLNWACLAMFLLSGVFVAGQFRQSPLDPVARLSGADRVPTEPVPWERIVVCLLAGLLCGALVFVMAPLLGG